MGTVDTLIVEGIRVSAGILLGPALVPQVVRGLYVIKRSIAAIPVQMGTVDIRAPIPVAVLRHLLPNNSKAC